MHVHLVLAFVALLWGLNPPAIKLGLPYVEPLDYNALRLLVALLVGWPLFRLLAPWQKFERQHLKPVLIASLGFFFFQIFFTYGVQATTVGNASLVLGCLPLSVAVINHFHKFESIQKRMILSICVSLSGVVLMVAGTGSEINFSYQHVFGAAILLAAQFAYGYYTVFSRVLTNIYSSYQATVYILLISNALFLLVATPSLLAINYATVPAIAWGSILYSGIFPLCLGNVLWIWGIKILGSAKTSLYNNLPPVFSIIAGYLFLNEPFGWLQFIGATVIFAGLYLAKGVKTEQAVNETK